jgi:hypothetical protein
MRGGQQRATFERRRLQLAGESPVDVRVRRRQLLQKMILT